MIHIDWNPTDRTLKQFGWISLIGFPVIGLFMIGYVIRDGDWQHWLPLAVTALGPVVLALSRVQPRAVKPVFVGMTLVALPIGLVVSTVLLTLIYYLLFTPAGLLFRLTGRDPLAKHPDPRLDSYWHVRGAPRSGASYLKMY